MATSGVTIEDVQSDASAVAPVLQSFLSKNAGAIARDGVIVARSSTTLRNRVPLTAALASSAELATAPQLTILLRLDRACATNLAGAAWPALRKLTLMALDGSHLRPLLPLFARIEAVSINTERNGETLLAELAARGSATLRDIEATQPKGLFLDRVVKILSTGTFPALETVQGFVKAGKVVKTEQLRFQESASSKPAQNRKPPKR